MIKKTLDIKIISSIIIYITMYNYVIIVNKKWKLKQKN